MRLSELLLVGGGAAAAGGVAYALLNDVQRVRQPVIVADQLPQPKVGAETISISIFPDDWDPTPGDQLKEAFAAAAKEYGIDPSILYGIARRETQFQQNSLGKKHGGNNATYAKSYARYSGQKIPGSGMTWGEMFTAEEWRPYGVTQLNPYHLVGRGKFVKAGAPKGQMLDLRNQARAAAALLVRLYNENGRDWVKALRRYNGSTEYQRDVASNILALRQVNGLT